MITTLLDSDAYQWYVGQLVWLRYPNLQVKYAFKNRTLSVPLVEHIDLGELREHVEEIRNLRYCPREIAYLRDLGLFSEGYLEFLLDLRLPEVNIENQDGWLNIEYEGDWASSIFWETPLLATINELYFMNVVHENETIDLVEIDGHRRLSNKFRVLKEHPEIQFMEFGTRRRFSDSWQDVALRRCLEEIPAQVLGTSNPFLAMKYGIPVAGTISHQIYMVLTARYIAHGLSIDPLRDAQSAVLEAWEELYGKIDNGRMLVSLADTYGTPNFLHNFSIDQASRWNIRQDSGEPIAVGEQIMQAYRKKGRNPQNHTIIFSDALDVNKMLAIAYHFEGKIGYKFGYGSDLSCDLGVPNVSIVIKPASVDGHSTVKLSDDLSKSTGSKDDINRYKELSAYGRVN